MRSIRRLGRFGLRLARLFAGLVWRTFGLAVLLCLALAIFVLLVLRGLFPAEELQAIVTAQLQEALRRPVSVVDVKVLFYQGVRIRGLRVVDAPGFDNGDFLTSDVVLAKYRWAPLLRRRLELDDVRLVSPRIRLIRRKDGEWNIADLLRPRTRRPGGPQVAVAADVIAVEHGSLAVSDRRRGREYEVRDLNLTIKGFDPGAPFPVEASFACAVSFGARRVDMAWALEGTADLAGLRWGDASLKAPRLSGEVAGRAVRGSGAVRGFLRPVVSLDLRLPPLDSSYLAAFSSSPAGVYVPASSVRLRLSVPATSHLRLDQFDAVVDPWPPAVAGGKVPQPVRLRASGGARFSVDGSTWRVTAAVPSFPLESAGTLWEGWGKYVLSGGLSATMTARLAAGPRGAAVALEKASVSFKDLGGVFFRDKRLFLAGLDGRLTWSEGGGSAVDVQRGRAVLYKTELADLDLGASVRKDDMDVERLNFTWSGSHVRVKNGKVLGRAPPREVAFDASADKLPLDAFIATIARVAAEVRASRQAAPPPEQAGQRLWSKVFKYSIPEVFPGTSGSITVQEVTHPHFSASGLKMGWDLRGISKGLGDVSGRVTVGFGPGRVADIPYFEKAHKILRVAFIPFVFMHKLNSMAVISAATAYPTSLDFTKIYGTYGLERGVVDVCMFHVDSGVLQAYGDGGVDFPRELVNLHILTRLTKSRGVLPETFSDAGGKPSIGFFVEGNLNKPELRLDLRKMAKDAIESSFTRGIERCRGAATK